MPIPWDIWKVSSVKVCPGGFARVESWGTLSQWPGRCLGGLPGRSLFYVSGNDWYYL